MLPSAESLEAALKGFGGLRPANLLVSRTSDPPSPLSESGFREEETEGVYPPVEWPLLAVGQRWLPPSALVPAHQPWSMATAAVLPPQDIQPVTTA